MKRDWDLLRKLLCDIEEDRDVFAKLPDNPKWQDQSEEEYLQQLNEFNSFEKKYFGHLEMLVDNRFVEGIIISRGIDGHFSYSATGPRLTMSGHDLLDTMRSSKIWKAIKSTAKSKGIELTFAAIKVLGMEALKHIAGT